MDRRSRRAPTAPPLARHHACFPALLLKRAAVARPPRSPRSPPPGAALGSDLFTAQFAGGPTQGPQFERNVDLLYGRIVSVVQQQLKARAASTERSAEPSWGSISDTAAQQRLERLALTPDSELESTPSPVAAARPDPCRYRQAPRSCRLRGCRCRRCLRREEGRPQPGRVRRLPQVFVRFRREAPRRNDDNRRHDQRARRRPHQASDRREAVPLH